METLFENLGLYSVLRSNPGLWVSLYGTYLLMALVPLLPFAQGLKEGRMARIGQAGTYLFYFFTISFMTVGPIIIQSYFLVLTPGAFLGILLVHVLMGAILFHVIPWGIGGVVKDFVRVSYARPVAAAGAFFLLTVPVYYYTVWAIIPFIMSRLG